MVAGLGISVVTAFGGGRLRPLYLFSAVSGPTSSSRRSFLAFSLRLSLSNTFGCLDDRLLDGVAWGVSVAPWWVKRNC